MSQSPILPDEIIAYIPQNSCFNIVKNKERSRVYRIENDMGNLFLKVTPSGLLENEVVMSSFLYKQKIGAQVVVSYNCDGYDYLLMKELPGNNALKLIHDQPEVTIRTFGTALYKLHNLPTYECPVSNTAEYMFNRAIDNYKHGKADKGLLHYLGLNHIDEAYKEMITLSEQISSPVVIHGDCCLPNLIIDENTTAGFIDVGNGGIGDRHYDIFWILWSLHFNLETAKYDQCFFESYDERLINKKLIRFFGLVSVLNGFRGHDYYDLWENDDMHIK